MAGTGVRHRVPTGCSKTVARFRERPAKSAGKATRGCTTKKPRGHHLRGQ